jgi:transposase-like protein
MKRNRKFPKYSTEEKEKILREFYDREGSADKIVLKYDLNSRKILYDWKKRWEETGSLKDNRGGNIKSSYETKVKTKDFKSMSKEELIEYIQIEEKIKKTLAELRKKNTK